MARRRDTATIDMFRDYDPPETMIARCDPDVMRGGSLDVKISSALSLAMDKCGKSREEIARAMTDFLGGQRVSKDMLDAYASPARRGHKITLERFMALLAVTDAYSLLAFICEAEGFVAVPKQYGKIVEAWHRKRVLDEQTRAYERIMAEIGDLK